MILYYTFRNFYSFGKTAIVDFRLPKTFSGQGFSEPKHSKISLSHAMVVVGPNASGKTNLIKPLAFFHWFVGRSFDSDPKKEIPFETHFFSNDQRCEFEIELIVGSDHWRYHVTLNRERVIHEALYRKTSKLFSYVFTRDWQHNAYVIRQQGFGMNPSEAKKVRQNASLISTAAQYNVPIALKLASLPIYTNVVDYGRVHFGYDSLIEASDIFSKSDSLRARMADYLRTWDLGLVDVQIKETAFTNPTNTHAVKTLFPFGVHKHGDQYVDRIFIQESSGTQGAYLLLSRLLPALETGGLAVIDELEADLHPHMLAPILDLFLSPETNPRQAQIIFTCHSPEILNTLEKQQIMLVEKDENGQSDAWRLDSMRGVRKDDNYYAKYMAGAYGAIPRV